MVETTAPYGENEHEHHLCGKWMNYKAEAKHDPIEDDNGVRPDECNALSRHLMWWMTPLVFGGLSRDALSGKEAPKLPPAYTMDAVGPSAIEAWEAEVEKARAASRPPSMFRVLRNMWWPLLLKGLLWSVAQGLLGTVVKPLLLLLLIDSIKDDATIDETQAYYIAGLTATLIAEGVATSASRQYFNDNFGSAYLVTCTSLLHWKAHTALPLDNNEKSILGSDIIKTYESFKQLCLLPMSAFSIVGGIIMLYITLGWVCSFGLAIIVGILLFTIYLATVTKDVEELALEAADERIAITTRIIEGIKAIKYCAWEQNFLNTVMASRQHESGFIQKTRMLHMTSIQVGRASPILAACCTFIILSAMGEQLEPARVFAGITIFQSLRLALTSSPIGITLSASITVALNRLTDYLEAEGVEARPTCEGVEIENAVCRWESSAFEVKVPSLKAEKGKVTAVVGQVGNGKTSLISAILGDMPLEEGRVNANNDIGYAPQRAFVVCGTIKDNILMGREYNEERFYDAITGAALGADLDVLPAGAMTAIGERGITLSGGQQQRVSVARVLYGVPKLLVLDDPLAAVDSTVAATIFESLVSFAHDKGCCVLVALNQLHFLPEADQILVMSGGVLSEQGTYQEVMALEGVLHAFVTQSELKLAGSQSQNTANAQGKATQGTEEEQKVSAELFRTEKKEKGEISDSVYKEYVASMGRANIITGVLLCQVAYLFMGFSDRWLALWIENDEDYYDEKELLERENLKVGNESKPDINLYAPIYGGGCVMLVVCLMISSVFFGRATKKAGNTLHNLVLERLLHAPVAWFQETPSGRIISRLSSDLSTVDNFLSQFFEHSINFACTVLVLFAIMIIVVPPVSVVLVLTVILYLFQIKAADATNRDLKRLANQAMGPVLTGMGETINGQGRTVLRVMGFTDHSRRSLGHKMDIMTRYNFLSAGVIAWQNMWCYTIATLISTCTGVYMLWGPSSFSASELGLALTYCFLLPYFLLYFSFTFSVLRICMTSLERLLQYKGEEVTQEPEWHLPTDKPGWPNTGSIAFEDVSLTYREGLPPALNGINLEIKSGERIGVVGRTGAGKSSLAVVLFRLVDVTRGRVLVDGEDIQGVGLQMLRKGLGMIPQEPLLMIGTVRTNLDPFDEHSDEEVSGALKRVGLEDLPMSTTVGAGADTLSSGQRQLISLARTLLRDVKVMVMDEPTSSIDPVTDANIQRVVREEFTSCTVITIAHRLHTVIDSDRVIVMSKGSVAEMGPPQVLMANPSSHLATMVNDLDRSLAVGR